MKKKLELPFINVRDLVMFPKMTQELYIGREQTISSIQYALAIGNKKVLVLTQKKFETLQPKGLRDMYSLGTICSVEGSVLLQDGTMKAMLTGESLVLVKTISRREGVPFAQGLAIKAKPSSEKSIRSDERLSVLELLVKAKPFASLDEDATWFEDLKNERKLCEFIENIQMNLNYSKTSIQQAKWRPMKMTSKKQEVQLVNSKIKIQQKLLAEMNLNKKMKVLEEYLKFEIRTTCS